MGFSSSSPSENLFDSFNFSRYSIREGLVTLQIGAQPRHVLSPSSESNLPTTESVCSVCFLFSYLLQVLVLVHALEGGFAHLGNNWMVLCSQSFVFPGSFLIISDSVSTQRLEYDADATKAEEPQDGGESHRPDHAHFTLCV